MKLETFDLKVIFMELFFCLRFWMVFKICLSINQHFSINQSKRVGEGGGEGGLGESVKKEKFVTQIYFLDNFESSSEKLM